MDCLRIRNLWNELDIILGGDSIVVDVIGWDFIGGRNEVELFREGEL